MSILCNLWLEANKLYDRANKLYQASLLTIIYVQHFLSPYIDSEVNHKRHFIKIPFINKGHTSQCKSAGGCYNELVVAYYGTGGGVKWRKR